MSSTSSLRSQQRDFTRACFINSALEVFEEVGFNDATIDMITRKAGANRSTFYLHFKDKVDLILASQEQLEPGAAVVYEPINNMIEPDYAQFRAWVDYMSGLWETNQKVYEAILHAQLAEPRFAKASYVQKFGFLEHYLERFGGSEPEEAKVRLEMFLMQLEMYFFTTICAGAEKPGPDDLDSLAKLGYYALFKQTA